MLQNKLQLINKIPKSPGGFQKMDKNKCPKLKKPKYFWEKNR